MLLYRRLYELNQTRNPNIQIRNKFKIQMARIQNSSSPSAEVIALKIPNTSASVAISFEHLVLFRISDFVLRVFA